MRKTLLYLFLFFFTIITYSQDGFLLQFDKSSLYLNPSETGFHPHKARILNNYRSQWSAIGDAIATKSISIDSKIGRVGVGAIWIANDAGKSSLSSSNALLSTSYYTRFNSRNYIFYGMQAGISQKSFKEENLLFESQYNLNNGFNSNIASGESFDYNVINSFDANAGIHWLYKSYFVKIKLGANINHITGTKNSFYGNNNINLGKRISGYLINDFTINRDLTLKSKIYFTKQGVSSLLLAGVNAKIKLDKYKYVNFGASNLFNEAIIIDAGMEIEQFFASFSFALTTSGLSSALYGYDGFEICVGYYIQPNSNKRRSYPSL